METNRIISLISSIRDGANLLIMKELAERRVTDISTSHGNILVQLYQHGSMPMSRLATLVGRMKNTITVLIRKLSEAGYVRLRKSDEDSRVTIVELTKKGEEFQKHFQDISRSLLKIVWGDMPKSERVMLMEGLQKLAKNLNRE